MRLFRIQTASIRKSRKVMIVSQRYAPDLVETLLQQAD